MKKWSSGVERQRPRQRDHMLQRKGARTSLKLLVRPSDQGALAISHLSFGLTPFALQTHVYAA